MFAKLLFIIALAAVPPLTQEQQDQLNTATDDSPRLEEPGLHALLTNVLQWESADEAGVRIPDYDALQADPAASRGELFLMEGQFAGRVRRYRLAEANPWFGDALTEWVIVVQQEPDEVAVVYFIDPDGMMQAPQAGANVRVVGRFYKVWADTDQNGEPARYLTFVARSARVVGGQAKSQPNALLLMLILVVVLAVAYILIRRMSRTEPRSARHSHLLRPHAMLSDPTETDPANALRHMAEQQASTRKTGNSHGDR